MWLLSEASCWQSSVEWDQRCSTLPPSSWRRARLGAKNDNSNNNDNNNNNYNNDNNNNNNKHNVPGPS